MSALDKLKQISLEEITPLEAAIVYLSGRYPEDAEKAAEEYYRWLAAVAELDDKVNGSEEE